jgi:hypothetical protein
MSSACNPIFEEDLSRSKGKFWTPAVVPALPLVIHELGDRVNPWDSQ